MDLHINFFGCYGKVNRTEVKRRAIKLTINRNTQYKQRESRMGLIEMSGRLPLEGLKSQFFKIESYSKEESKNDHKASEVKYKQRIKKAEKTLKKHLGWAVMLAEKKLCKY